MQADFTGGRFGVTKLRHRVVQKLGCALSTAASVTENQVQQEQCCVEICEMVSLYKVLCTQISQQVCFVH